MRFFLFSTFLLFNFSGFGQATTLNFSVTLKDLPCELIVKEVALYHKDTDSLIYINQSDTCNFSIPVQVGIHYELKIRSQQSKPFSQEIYCVTADSVQLNELVLEESVSELDEVTITGIQRKFMQVDAEKTTITVTDNPILEISSVYDAILKIPGVVPYPGGGFALGGQMANIQFDGIPSSLGTTDLMNLLKSMPATSVTSIELVANPGASYDASYTGSVINLVSQGIVSKWFSATLSVNYGLNQNQKVSPSLLMSGKGKKFTWQLQTGMSYNERTSINNSQRDYTGFDSLVSLTTDRKDQNYNRYAYFNPGITIRLKKKDLLSLNYRLSGNLNNTAGNSNSGSIGLDTAINLGTAYRQLNNGLSQSLNLRYKHYFDTLDRLVSINVYSSYTTSNGDNQTDQLLDSQRSYSLIRNRSNSAYLMARSDFEIPWKKIKLTWNNGLKYVYTQQRNLGKYNLQSASDAIYQNSVFPYQLDFTYHQNNLAVYTELKKGFGKKFFVTAGVRAEDYLLTFKNMYDSTIRRSYLNIFPSVHLLYSIIPEIKLFANYSRKINMPSASQFDPNLSGYYDSYSSSSGNSELKPNFYNQGELKLTIFDYMELSVNVSHATTEVLNEITVNPNSLVANSTFRTYNNVTNINYFMSLPVPFGLFTKGMKFFDENIDVDNISFMYLYANCSKTNIPGYNYLNGNKGLWSFGVYSQFMLPWKLRLNVEFNYTKKGSYQIYYINRANSGLEFVLSREFYDRKLRASVSFQDIFNQTQYTVLMSYNNLNVNAYSKNDTRILWFKLSYTFGRVEKNSEGMDLPSKPNMDSGM